jgi:RNA polymerase sigma factor (TIGR02999 family)
MADVTELLDRWNAGDGGAMQELQVLVYAELRRMAGAALRDERPGHTLQPTALVHELYLRLAGLREMRVENRRHFYGAAAQAMRRILVDHARRRTAQKRGGVGSRPVPLDEVPEAALAVGRPPDLERLDDALAALARVAPEKAQLVELRFFAGLSAEDTAALLGLSTATVGRHWAFARAWLYRYMTSGHDDD